MAQSSFIRGLLDDPEDPQLPQYDPYAGLLTAKQAALFAAGLAPGAGVADAAGYMPRAEGGFSPSMRENIQQGNYGSAALQGAGAVGDAASVVPGLGTLLGGALKGVAGAGALYKALKATAPEIKGLLDPSIVRSVGGGEPKITAYHASPYSFDKFDLNKAGSESGQQVFGRGIYAADREANVKEYLARADAMSATPRWFIRGEEAEQFSPQSKAASILTELGPSQARKFADRTVADFASDPNRVRELENWKQIQELLGQGLTKKDIEKKFGYTYELNLKTDPNRMLDWDAKLGDQSPQVQDAYRQLMDSAIFKRGDKATGGRSSREAADWKNLKGKDLFSQAFAGTGNLWGDAAHKQVSNALQKFGLQGNRHLVPAGSQGAVNSKGERNFVIFDPKNIEIIRKYGLAGLLGGGAAAYGASQDGGTSDATPSF